MIKFSNEKIYNAYLIETYNYENIKRAIFDFAISHGFDRHLVEAGTHPDIITLEAENSIIPLKEIRQKIINTVDFAPTLADKKFYIIYDAKNIVEASENAMLKTLEEPPEFVSFFLVTDNISSLLDTIKSRCQILKDTDDIDYKKVHNLSLEAAEKLGRIRPDSLGQAGRISGVSPADITALMIYLKKEGGAKA